MAPSMGVWAPVAIKILRSAALKTSRLIKLRITDIIKKPVVELQPILVRNLPRHAISRAAAIRQGKGRWYTTHSAINAGVRRYLSSGSGAAKYDRSAFPKSAVGTAVSRLTSRAPFASTLRPNLTGGALPRTAGGYGLGGGRVGGARYFSHTPAAPAQVVNNVSAAIRAFCLSGNKVRFDGLNERGDKKYLTVSKLEAEASQKVRSSSKFSAGSYIDFHVSPTVTALSPLKASTGCSETQYNSITLNTEGFLDSLSGDFSRTLQDFAAIMNDLKRLSVLGDLHITLENDSLIRVRFPGYDAESLERLCDEIGILRGIIHQDSDFETSVGAEVALKFPFAETSEDAASSPAGSLRSQKSSSYGERTSTFDGHSLPTTGSCCETIEELSDNGSYYFRSSEGHPTNSDFQGVEGIYRFIEECDAARRIRV